MKPQKPSRHGAARISELNLGGLDARPVIVALAGSNGAGKTTFYEAHLQPAGLRFLNADLFGRELGVGAYEAARIITTLRHELVRQRESFVLETVFSDPVGEKLAFLNAATQSGYTVVLCFIGIENPEVSEERVSMRVSQGGHDVPSEKLISRFPRTLANLRTALHELPHVFIFDNSDLQIPFERIAVFENGRSIYLKTHCPPGSGLFSTPVPEVPGSTEIGMQQNYAFRKTVLRCAQAGSGWG